MGKVADGEVSIGEMGHPPNGGDTTGVSHIESGKLRQHSLPVAIDKPE